MRVLQAAMVVVCCGVISHAQAISRAYADKSGSVHVVDGANVDHRVAVEKDQVTCENVRVASDHETVAWSVLYENCCTSYPIPLKVVIYRHGRLTRVSPPQMIWDWKFVSGGSQIAVSFGPVHGDASGAELYDARAGKRLASWNLKGERPKWADGLRTE